MEKTRKLVVAFFAMTFIVCLFTVFDSNSTWAKSNKTYYQGSFRGNEKDVDKIGIVSKVEFEGDKMTVYGSLVKAKKEKNLYTNTKAKYCKKKKRTFKLHKNVKFYTAGGLAGEIEDSREDFIEFCDFLNDEPNGLSYMFVVKNGKVRKIEICS